MQHIGIWLVGEQQTIIEKSDINFAPVVRAVWAVKEYEKQYPFLVGVDPYGDTYFNVHQAPVVIEELEKLKHEASSKDALKEIADTTELLKKVKQHTFAKFIGD